MMMAVAIVATVATRPVRVSRTEAKELLDAERGPLRCVARRCDARVGDDHVAGHWGVGMEGQAARKRADAALGHRRQTPRTLHHDYLGLQVEEPDRRERERKRGWANLVKCTS